MRIACDEPLCLALPLRSHVGCGIYIPPREQSGSALLHMILYNSWIATAERGPRRPLRTIQGGVRDVTGDALFIALGQYSVCVASFLHFWGAAPAAMRGWGICRTTVYYGVCGRLYTYTRVYGVVL